MPGPLLPPIKRLLETSEPPELGPGPRAGVRPEPDLNKSLQELFVGAKLPARNRELIRSLVLLWHDHLDAAHTIAQDVADRDGSFVHGIMHRREPDFSNAKYWFRRVGEHPSFSEIAKRAAARLGAGNERELRDELLPKEKWDAFAFIDACEQASQRSAPVGRKDLLRELQRIETETLLEHLLA